MQEEPDKKRERPEERVADGPAERRRPPVEAVCGALRSVMQAEAEKQATQGYKGQIAS